MSLCYELDNLVELELDFANPELNRQHGFCGDEDIDDEVEAFVPLRLAVDAAQVLRKVAKAEQENKCFVEASWARERVSRALHEYFCPRNGESGSGDLRDGHGIFPAR